jgi:NADH-quinone oxidoreductase subunit J
MLDTVLFYSFAVLVLGGGILTITRRNAVHSAISLIVSLLGVAGLYLLQAAEFLFAVQIVLYVGGIMVLFLFVIMLVNLEQNIREYQFNKQWLVGTIVALALGGLLLFVYRTGRGTFPTVFYQGYRGLEGDNTQQIGLALYGQYMLPFEIRCCCWWPS